MRPLRVLVVGLGNMGRSHARAYAAIEGYELVGICARGIAARTDLGEFEGVPLFADFADALEKLRPAVVSINTYPDTHAQFAVAAMEAGAHVFVEKPLAQTIELAETVVETAVRTKRKVLVGYILRVHPAWTLFIERARSLGKPLVMRMNLNQQADGAGWRGMQNLMQSLSPLVDCGVHYVDMMALATGARPLRVHAIGARLSDSISDHVHNYGQLQVTFDDGSVGWYEAGWGPMMSETAYSVKDIIGPKGAVSMVAGPAKGSADVSGHTSVSNIRVHHGRLDDQGRFERADELLSPITDLSHDELCALEQHLLLDAIRNDLDLTVHLQQAVDSLRVVLAAEESIRTGQVVALQAQ